MSSSIFSTVRPVASSMTLVVLLSRLSGCVARYSLISLRAGFSLGW